MSPDNAPPSRWRAIQIGLGRGLSQTLFNDVLKQPVTLDETRAVHAGLGVQLAFFVASAIYLVSLAIAAAGVALIAFSGGRVISVLGGALCLLIAALSLPRFVRAPARLLSRQAYPVLHELSDQLALALRAPPVAGIGVSTDFNANYRMAGWKGLHYVEMGAALVAVLSIEEFIATLAHELSHGANGDPLRGRYFGGALDTVVRWGIVVRPTSLTGLGDGMRYGGIISIVGIPVAAAALLLSEALFLVAKGLYLLLLRQSQRAEYLADLLAANVSGTRAMISQLEKHYLFNVVDTAVQRFALGKPDTTLQAMLVNAVNEVPQSRLERMRVESREENWQVDSTHPPTAMRIDMLEAREAMPAAFRLSEEKEQALAQELARLVESMREAMTSEKIEAMYF